MILAVVGHAPQWQKNTSRWPETWLKKTQKLPHRWHWFCSSPIPSSMITSQSGSFVPDGSPTCWPMPRKMHVLNSASFSLTGMRTPTISDAVRSLQVMRLFSITLMLRRSAAVHSGFQKEENWPVKARRSRSQGKRMFAVFFDSQGVIANIKLEGQATVTARWYIEICLPEVIESIKRRCPRSGLRSLKLHHDNALAHTTILTREFLHKKILPTLPVHLIHPICHHVTFGYSPSWKSSWRDADSTAMKRLKKQFVLLFRRFLKKSLGNSWIDGWAEHTSVSSETARILKDFNVYFS